MKNGPWNALEAAMDKLHNYCIPIGKFLCMRKQKNIVIESISNFQILHLRS